jgi:hypothetical protein
MTPCFACKRPATHFRKWYQKDYKLYLIPIYQAACDNCYTPMSIEAYVLDLTEEQYITETVERQLS